MATAGFPRNAPSTPDRAPAYTGKKLRAEITNADDVSVLEEWVRLARDDVSERG
jgi:hypothetical protein